MIFIMRSAFLDARAYSWSGEGFYPASCLTHESLGVLTMKALLHAPIIDKTHAIVGSAFT